MPARVEMEIRALECRVGVDSPIVVVDSVVIRPGVERVPALSVGGEKVRAEGGVAAFLPLMIVVRVVDNVPIVTMVHPHKGIWGGPGGKTGEGADHAQGRHGSSSSSSAPSIIQSAATAE